MLKRRQRNIIRLGVLATGAAISTSLAIWLLFPPIRVAAPGLNGVTCFDSVCVERSSLLTRAAELHRDAMSDVAAKARPLSSPPRTIFCSTQRCFRSFGGKGRAMTVFDLGVVIAPESWQAHIVEHEFIHMLQAQELGLRGREASPDWFKEGMAFHLSEPPDFDLPDYARPLASKYCEWERRVGRENVWREIRRL